MSKNNKSVVHKAAPSGAGDKPTSPASLSFTKTKASSQRPDLLLLLSFVGVGFMACIGTYQARIYVSSLAFEFDVHLVHVDAYARSRQCDTFQRHVLVMETGGCQWFSPAPCFFSFILIKRNSSCRSSHINSDHR